MLSTLAVANGLEYNQLEVNKDEKKKFPTNRLARLNKMMNQYTVWAKGLQIAEDIDLDERNLGKALSRNNRWFNGLSETFNRLDHTGAPVKCSSYFHPNDEERKRRSTGGLDLMPDMDTEIEKCEIAAEEAEEMGENCTDCCEKDANGDWILNTDITVNFQTKNRQVTKPEDLAKAFRRVIGATKRWERRYIAECGGSDMRPVRYYNILLKRLRNGLKSNEITAQQILLLKWKRVFSNRQMDHSEFYAALGISQPE